MSIISYRRNFKKQYFFLGSSDILVEIFFTKTKTEQENIKFPKYFQNIFKMF